MGYDHEAVSVYFSQGVSPIVTLTLWYPTPNKN